MTLPAIESQPKTDATRSLRPPGRQGGDPCLELEPAGSEIELPPERASTIDLRFDRGTLLLDAPEAAASARLAELGLRWDPRVDAFRAPAHQHDAIRRVLVSEGRQPGRELLIGASVARVSARFPELRGYQAEALEAWERAGRRGIVALPTGSGKTHVAVAALARLACPTLVLVPTRVLLAQWAYRIREVYDGPLGQIGDGVRLVEAVTIATFESAYRYLDEIGHRFGLLVVDEVHHFGSGARAEALEMCTAPARLGLSATPPGMTESEAAARLEELVGKTVCQCSVAELSGTALAPFEQLSLFVDLTRAERAAYDRARGRFLEAFHRYRMAGGDDWRGFAIEASATHEGRRAVAAFHEARRIVSLAEEKLELAEQLLAREREGDGRVLLFTADNRAAYALSRRLLVPAITCEIGRAERARILERLGDGRLRAVISARVLNEGLDLPDASVGIVVGGSLGAREHVQRVGRLLRPRPGKRARVYEIVVRSSFEVGHAARRQRALG
jgi:superfamily II DNA or RNA helicase